MSRSTKLGPGGNSITNASNYTFNKFKGQKGIGATSTSNYYAVKRLASFCKSECVNLETIPETIPETILQFNTSQGNSFVWNPYTFILNSSLPNFSYVANITSIPASTTPVRSFLINAKIGNNVTSIGNNAFSICSALTSITIPNSVTSIGNGAFALCSALTSITIPNSVTSIGVNAFGGCSALTNVIISNATAAYLGNLLNKTWTSPGTVVSPDFYGAPSTIIFVTS